MGSVSEFVILLPTGFEPPHRELNPCNNSNEEYLHDDSWTHGFDIAHRAARFSESLGLLGGEEASRLGKYPFVERSFSVSRAPATPRGSVGRSGNGALRRVFRSVPPGPVVGIFGSRGLPRRRDGRGRRSRRRALGQRRRARSGAARWSRPSRGPAAARRGGGAASQRSAAARVCRGVRESPAAGESERAERVLRRLRKRAAADKLQSLEAEGGAQERQPAVRQLLGVRRTGRRGSAPSVVPLLRAVADASGLRLAPVENPKGAGPRDAVLQVC